MATNHEISASVPDKELLPPQTKKCALPPQAESYFYFHTNNFRQVSALCESCFRPRLRTKKASHIICTYGREHLLPQPTHHTYHLHTGKDKNAEGGNARGGGEYVSGTREKEH